MATDTAAFKHVNYGWDDAVAGQLDPVGAAGLPLEPAGRRRAHHQHRRRQHLVQDDRDRPAHRRAGRSAVGQGLGRRPAHRQAREFLLALSWTSCSRLQQHYHHAPQRGPEDRRSRTPWSALYRHCTFNLNPRAVVDRHPAARASCPCRHVDHMHPNAVIAIAAAQQLRAADARDLRRRGGLDAVAAARLRPGPEAGADRAQTTRRPRA